MTIQVFVMMAVLVEAVTGVAKAVLTGLLGRPGHKPGVRDGDGLYGEDRFLRAGVAGH